MTKLIINADDFGYSEAVNYGIISAHRDGVVTSTTLMANMPGAKQAMELAKEYKELGCGVHMTLTCGRPLLDTHKTIVDEEGNLFKRFRAPLIAKMDLEEVYEEFCAQIDSVIASGVKVTHLDSHHHVHTYEPLKPVIERIAEKYKLPLRGGFEYEFNSGVTVPMLFNFYKENVEVEYFEKNLEELKSYKELDLMCHPAYVDQTLLGGTSYSMERIKEHAILTEPRLKKYLLENGFELSNYNDINR